MARPTKKNRVKEPASSPQAADSQASDDNIIDFNQYKRNLNRVRRQDKTEPQIADQFKQGAPIQGKPSKSGLAGTPGEEKAEQGHPQEENAFDKAAGERDRRRQTNTVNPENLQGKDLSRLKGASAPDKKLIHDLANVTGRDAPLTNEQKKRQLANANPEAQQLMREKGLAPPEEPSKSGLAGTPGEEKAEQGESNQQPDTAKNEGSKKRELDSKKSKDKKEEGGKEKKVGPGQHKVDTIGKILFFFLLCFAVLIDLLPFISAGLFSFIDWIFDFAFYFFLFIVLFVVTGDIFGSLIGKKGTTNMIQTAAEFIPGIDILPLHVLALILIYFDLQYNILSGFKKIAKLK